MGVPALPRRSHHPWLLPVRGENGRPVLEEEMEALAAGRGWIMGWAAEPAAPGRAPSGQWLRWVTFTGLR